MTINIALATFDGLILGCDSLSSILETAIFPFRTSVDLAYDKDGNLLIDKNGNVSVPLTTGHYTDVATTVFGGVSKMFCLYQDDETCVAAVTAGLAILGGVTIAEQAKRFKRKTASDRTELNSVEDVARAFAEFITSIWNDEFHPDDNNDRPRETIPNIQFILAGFGKNDYYGKIYRIDISSGGLNEQFPDGNHMGMCWGGMADYVERLVRGFDASLKHKVGRQLAGAMKKQRETTINDISQALIAAKVVVPDDLDVQVTEEQPPTLPWDSTWADIDFGNLSTQYAVELVEMLVNTQSGMQRFARGIPTVGGRTHIGVLKRGEGLQLLNEPKLQHKHTGYADDF